MRVIEDRAGGAPIPQESISASGPRNADVVSSRSMERHLVVFMTIAAGPCGVRGQQLQYFKVTGDAPVARIVRYSLGRSLM